MGSRPAAADPKYNRSIIITSCFLALSIIYSLLLYTTLRDCLLLVRTFHGIAHVHAIVQHDVVLYRTVPKVVHETVMFQQYKNIFRLYISFIFCGCIAKYLHIRTTFLSIAAPFYIRTAIQSHDRRDYIPLKHLINRCVYSISNLGIVFILIGVIFHWII